MDERIMEELTEQELMRIVGGTESQVMNIGDKCPSPGCKGTLVKNGNKYVCSDCFKAYIKKLCKNCGVETYCTEYTGGRLKCTVCQKDPDM